MTKILKFLSSQMFTVAVLVLVQLLVLIGLIMTLSEHFVLVYGVLLLLSASMLIYIVNAPMNADLKLPWVICILIFPLFGGLFYFYFGRNALPPKIKKQLDAIDEKSKNAKTQNFDLFKKFEMEDQNSAMQFRYLDTVNNAILHENTDVSFLSPGEDFFKVLTEELEKAEKYIFMEYFIIEEGKMLNTILDILERKAKEGVDVRLMYDDAGSITLLPRNYNKTLEKRGIKCEIFNPIKPRVTAVLQNRDHRKITVIDGKVGFTGGINLADEYINHIDVHGHWKDSAIVCRGEAVYSLTVMFLTQWSFYRDKDEDFTKYKTDYKVNSNGYIQIYGDTPFDNELVGETVYLNMINNASDYIYMESPYLIVDNNIITALTMAAKRGVDVRLVTPHHGDKWYVHTVTRSYYQTLIDAGVKIFEYTPGFIHAKVFVCDDKLATVGTVNLDYRSLYHHYECGTLMYKTPAVMQIKEDFNEIIKVSIRITKEDCAKVLLITRYFRGIMRIFAPLM